MRPWGIDAAAVPPRPGFQWYVGKDGQTRCADAFARALRKRPPCFVSGPVSHTSNCSLRAFEPVSQSGSRASKNATERHSVVIGRPSAEFAYPAGVTAPAQEVSGTPGSPPATATISSNELPAPAPKFGRVVKEELPRSTSWRLPLRFATWAPSDILVGSARSSKPPEQFGIRSKTDARQTGHALEVS